MSCRVLSRRSLSLASTLPRICRHFSSYDERRAKDFFFQLNIQSNDVSVWPDTRLGPLEPSHRLFPLPGLVGSVEFHSKQKQQSTVPQRRHKPRYDVDVLVAELPHERQSTVFEQFITINKQLSEPETQNAASPFDNLDCAAYECPFLLRKDFFDLFPTSDVSLTHNLTVITLSQKNTNKSLRQDSVKNLQQEDTKKTQQEEMQNATEDDSKSLMNDFVTAATDICQLLHSAGYWADFLDPTSGRPYVDVHVNASQYEVDERYRRCGFEIESSVAGQCRVLRHHALGSKSFVGCVFTSAPTDHPLIANIAHSQS